MKPANELAGVHLVGRLIDAQLIADIAGEHINLRRTEHLCVVDIPNEDVSMLTGFYNFGGYMLERHLDRFFLWMPSNDENADEDLVEAFFEFIAEDYESLIDVPRNLDNIEKVLGVISMHCTSPSTLLDFGCGTGLSIGPATNAKLPVIGFDPCGTMRRIAASRGMTTWDSGNLARQQANALDGVFASYVFHLLATGHSLRLAWSRLRKGGILVGNFHKGKGIEEVEAIIASAGGATAQFVPLPTSDRHGDYVAYIK